MGQSKKQKRTKKNKKNAKLTEKRNEMDWAGLPPKVIEKIVGHAVKGDREKTEPKSNWYLMRVYKYGQVHQLWKEAICVSRNIFNSYPEFIESASQQVFVGEYGIGRPILPQPVIDGGYLQAVKSLGLWFVEPPRNFTLKSLCESLTVRNSVEHFNLKLQCNLPEKLSRQIVQLLTQLKKMRTIGISIEVGSQAQAKWLWQVMRVTVHTTSRPITINWDYADTGNSINWSFVNREERLDNGTIELFSVIGNAPTGFFNKLAQIDLLVVVLDDVFFLPENCFIEEAKAKRLQIYCDIDQENHVALMNRLQNDNVQRRRRAFKADTIECLVDVDGVNTVMNFENDAQVWEKIKEWLRKVFEGFAMQNMTQILQDLRMRQMSG